MLQVGTYVVIAWHISEFPIDLRKMIEKIGNFTDKYVTLVVSDEPVLSYLILNILISNLILTVKQISNVPTLCSRQETDINN